MVPRPTPSPWHDIIDYEMVLMEGLPSMIIYPDGRNGNTEIPVVFEVPSDFDPLSPIDRFVRIHVFDLTVALTGSLIPGPTPDWDDPQAWYEMEFARDPSPID